MISLNFLLKTFWKVELSDSSGSLFDVISLLKWSSIDCSSIYRISEFQIRILEEKESA